MSIGDIKPLINNIVSLVEEDLRIVIMHETKLAILSLVHDFYKDKLEVSSASI